MTEEYEPIIQHLCIQLSIQTDFPEQRFRGIIEDKAIEVGIEPVSELVQRLLDKHSLQYAKNPFRYLQTCFSNIKAPRAAHKPSSRRMEEPREETPTPMGDKSIEEEIASEERDKENFSSMRSILSDEGFTFRESKELRDVNPLPLYLVSGFEGSHQEKMDLMAKYEKYTFIVLYRQSRQEGTSIHELCRRLGLSYERIIY